MTEDPQLLSGQALWERAARALRLPLPTALGVRLLDESAPALGAVLDVDGLVDNGVGAAHAGAVSVLLEVAGYLALAPSLTTSEHAVTHSCATTLIRAASSGDRIAASGVLDHRTRRVAFLAVTAHVGEVIVARSTLVKSIVPYAG